LNKVDEFEPEPAPSEPPRRRGRPRTNPPKKKKRSTTDPDATMATSSKKQRLEPSYKQHTAVDDRAGVVVDVAVTTGEVNEGTQLVEQIERVEALTEVEVETATADAAYAHSANYQQLEGRGTDAVIPPQREPRKPKRIPASRFKYDAKHHVVRCPGGKRLERKGRCKSSTGWYYRARACDCRACPLRPRCFGQHANARTIVIVDGYEALLRARRRWRRKDEGLRNLYGRHRWRAEGAHAEGKTRHGLRRAVRRGVDNVAIQAYLTAAVMNLKRLATAVSRLGATFHTALYALYVLVHRPRRATPHKLTI